MILSSKKVKKAWPQSRESREIFGETETTKKAPRRDQSRGLESRLHPLPLAHQALGIFLRHWD